MRDKQEQELQEFSNASNDPFIGALATDGWKKKACSQGTPLISCNITKPNVVPTSASPPLPTPSLNPPCCTSLQVIRNLAATTDE